MEVSPHLVGLVAHVVDERPLQERRRLVLQLAGERLQYRQIGRALQVEHPTRLVGLVILIEADVFQGLENL